MTAWGNFFVALAGAAAALTGLLFVGVSISLNRILQLPRLADRALESLILLIHIVLISAVCLIPGQTMQRIGIEILAIGLLTWVVILFLDIRMLRSAELRFRFDYTRNLVLSQLSLLPFLFSAIAVLREGEKGIYYLVPGILFSLIKSLSDAWVLLVEIHR